MTQRLPVFAIRPGLAALLLALVALLWASPAWACLSGDYARLSAKCEAQGWLEQLASVVMGGSPRHIAVVAGISEYPRYEKLDPAGEDVKNMVELLRNQLGFDEVIRIENDDFNIATLSYIFNQYLPNELRQAPGSQVLFTFSGHGASYAEQGYLFTNQTTKATIDGFEDTTNAIPLDVLKALMLPTVKASNHFLFLLNACKGGYFFKKPSTFGGERALNEKAADAITAGGKDDNVEEGSHGGSLFFEQVQAALTGTTVTLKGTDYPPPGNDLGYVTVTSLAAYLRSTISVVENNQIVPLAGTIFNDEPSEGEFFFITNREKANTSFSTKYPKEYHQTFGGGTAAGTTDWLDAGFTTADVDDSGAELIRDDAIIGEGYTIKTQPWPRKSVVESDERSFVSAIAADVGGSLSLFYTTGAGNSDHWELYRYDTATGKETMLDSLKGEMDWCDGREPNLKRIGMSVIYYLGCEGKTRAYDLKTGKVSDVAQQDVIGREYPTLFRSPDEHYMLGQDLVEFNFLQAFDVEIPEGATPDWIGVYGPLRDDEPHLAVSDTTTGFIIYDRILGLRNFPFMQEQSPHPDDPNREAWAIGSVAWAPDSAGVYFDNSGAMACIWEFDLNANVVTKIVPEHEAEEPFALDYGGQRYVVYVDNALEQGVGDKNRLRIAKRPAA